MKKASTNNKLSRAKFLSFLGIISLLPITSKASQIEQLDPDFQEYDVLLKPDGTTVKVKRKILIESKKIKNKMDNPTMRSWLKK